MKKNYVWLLVVIFAGLAILTGSCKKESPLLKDADSAYLAGDYQKAIGLYNAYLEGTPDQAKVGEVKNKISEAYYQLGEKAFSEQNWSEAINYYSQSQNPDAKNKISKAYFNLGEQLFNEGQYESAIDNYSKSQEPGVQDKIKAAQDALALAEGGTLEESETPAGGGGGGVKPPSGKTDKDYFVIKVASFPAQSGAQKMVNELKSKGFNAYQVVNKQKQHTVFVGKFASREKAQNVLARIKAMGGDYANAVIVKKED